MGALKVLIAGMSQTGGGGASDGIGGTTGTTDNAITRADGTAGSTLQAGGTNPPTYDDLGTLSLGGGNAFLTGEASNTLALRNGANAQTLGVYNTFTDASNYSRVALLGNGSFQTEQAGTGTALAINIATTGDTSIKFWTNNTFRWTVLNTGHLVASADNTYDIGASGAARPRNLFIAGKLNMTGIPTSSSGLSSGDVWSNLGILTIVA